MFEGDEYRSYIQLCRELRLERIVQPWDLFAALGPQWEPERIRVHAHDDDMSHGPFELPDDYRWWLPRLDQWLAMLREAGARDIEFLAPWGDGRREVVTDEFPHVSGIGTSDEEAAARLWMAVTGRAVTSG